MASNRSRRLQPQLFCVQLSLGLRVYHRLSSTGLHVRCSIVAPFSYSNPVRAMSESFFRVNTD